MAHTSVENFTDYFVVMHRVDGGDAKDERFVTRAFASSGFEDQDSGDDGVVFRHEETELQIACDGDVVTIPHPVNGNYEPASLMFGDIFLALQRMEWGAVKVYCDKEPEDVLRDMASRLPASYVLDISLAEVEPTASELHEIRDTIAAQRDRVEEPSINVGDLMRGPVERAALPDQHAEEPEGVRTVATAEVPKGELAAARALSLPSGADTASSSSINITPPAQAPAPLDRDGTREQEVAALHEIIRHLQLQLDMARFGNAVVSSNALYIAHLYAHSLGQLPALGFEQVGAAFSHPKHSVVVDGAFLVSTKDCDDLEWFDTLLNALGGQVQRVWQADASGAGDRLHTRWKAGFASHARDGRVGASPAHFTEQRQPAPIDLPGSEHLSDGQRNALAAMSGTFTSLMLEVLKTSNQVGALAGAK